MLNPNPNSRMSPEWVKDSYVEYQILSPNLNSRMSPGRVKESILEYQMLSPNLNSRMSPVRVNESIPIAYPMHSPNLTLVRKPSW